MRALTVTSILVRVVGWLFINNVKGFVLVGDIDLSFITLIILALDSILVLIVVFRRPKTDEGAAFRSEIKFLRLEYEQS